EVAPLRVRARHVAFDAPERAAVVDLQHRRQMGSDDAAGAVGHEGGEGVCTHECMRLAGVPDLEVLGRIHEPLSSILWSDPMVSLPNHGWCGRPLPREARDEV